MEVQLKVLFMLALILSASISVQAESYYMAKVNFGGKDFIDVFSFKKAKVDSVKKRKVREGTLTVPGQFTTKFVAENIQAKARGYTFSTKAMEFGRELSIRGEIFFNEDESRVEGKLFVSLPGKETVEAKLNGPKVYKK